MRLSLAALLLTGALAPMSAQAMDATGFYAGIYATGGTRNDVDLEYADGGAFFGGASGLGAPASIANDGLRDLTFDLLLEGQSNFPGFTDGFAGFQHLFGSLAFGGGAGAGAVLGYGFGNGLRVEADLSAMSFAARDARLDTVTVTEIDGELDGSNNWTWTVFDEYDEIVDDTVPAELLTQGARLSSSAVFFLLNAHYDIATGSSFTPYVSAGAGFAQLSSSVTSPCLCADQYSFSDSAFVPAAQLGGGLRAALSDPVTLDIGYRYKMAGSATLTSGEIALDTGGLFLGRAQRQTGMLGIHAIQAGLTFALP